MIPRFRPQGADAGMKLSDILLRSCVRVPLEAHDRDGAIEELVDLLVKSGQVSNRDALLSSVMAREHVRSTGIGCGLAVPHGKAAGCERLAMAVGRPASPIDFSSIDGRPVEVVTLLASPVDQNGPHIQALARISRLMLTDSFRGAILRANTADELYAVIVDHDM